MWLTTPAEEYWRNYGYSAFDSQKVVCILAMWILVMVPLVQGPKSLVKCFSVGFPLLLFLNALLFIRAVSLPHSGIGLRYVFQHGYGHGYGFKFYDDDPSFPIWRMCLGFWFSAEYGLLFSVGKYIPKRTFPLPHVAAAAALSFAFYVLNICKFGALSGHYTVLVSPEIRDFFIYSDLGPIPVLLSQLPGSTFWLIVHFLFNICARLPALSFAMETIAVALTELLPRFLGHRTELPRNLIVTIVLSLFGSALTIVFKYINTGLVEKHQWRWTLLNYLEIIYYLALYLVAVILVPLSLSKVANAGRQTLLDFVRDQGGPSWAKARKRAAIATVVIACFSGWASLYLATGLWGQVDKLISSGSAAYVGIIFGVILLIVVGAALVQVVLFRLHESRFPCCRSVGETVDREETADGVELGTMS